MDAVRTKVMPEHTCGNVAQGIKKIVGNHLRFAARSTGKVHQHGVFVVVNVAGTHKGSGLFYARLPAMEALGHVGADANERLHRRTVGHCALQLRKNIVFAHTYDGLNAGAIVAINNVVGGEHVGGGNGHSAYLAQGQHGNPPFVLTFKDEHHHVATANTQLLEVRSSAIALSFQLCEGENVFSAFVASPYKGRFFGGFGRPSVHHIVSEIKVIRNDELKVLIIIFCRSETCLL